jgi:hypothetical protein
MDNAKSFPAREMTVPDGRGILKTMHALQRVPDREPRMKKIYEKPRLDKRGKLSSVVAAAPSKV